MSEYVECPQCKTLNPTGSSRCGKCGQDFGTLGGYMTPQSNQPQPKKKSAVVAVFAGLVIGVGLLGGLYAIFPKPHSGITINGTEMSVSEAKKGIREVELMGQQAGSGKKVTYLATTPFSQRFKEYLLEIDACEEKLGMIIDESPLDKLFESPLETKKQRDMLRAEIVNVNNVMIAYFDAESKAVTDFRAFLEDAIKPTPVKDYGQAQGLQSLKADFAKVTQARLAFVDFLDKHPPETQNGKPFMFGSPAEVKECNRLIHALDAASDQYEKSITQFQVTMQKVNESSLDGLKDL